MSNFDNSTDVLEKSRLVFDASDIDYLVTHFSLPQLRAEAHHADIKFSVSRALCEPDYYQLDYLEACRMAADIKRALVPKVSRGETSYPAMAGIDIQQVKERHDIVDVISQFTTLRKSGNRYYGKCPLHNDRHASLTVYPHEQRWWCFGCNEGGDVIDFIAEVITTDTKGAIKYLEGGN